MAKKNKGKKKAASRGWETRQRDSEGLFTTTDREEKRADRDQKVRETVEQARLNIEKLDREHQNFVKAESSKRGKANKAKMVGPFKNDLPLVIVLGSQSTRAQLGVSEIPLAPNLCLPTRMFPGLEPNTFEPIKIVERKTEKSEYAEGDANDEQETVYEEDPTSDEGAIYPIQDGYSVKGTCLLAFLKHVHNLINPPLNTPVLIVVPPAFNDLALQLMTKFAFDTWSSPALTFLDSTKATQMGYNAATCVVIDVGFTKTDVTAIQDWEIEHTGRVISLPDTGGEAMTQRLLELLAPKGFSRDMCEQLKKSGICEILPSSVSLPSEKGSIDNTTNLVTTTTGGSTSGQRASVSGQGGAHVGSGLGARNDDDVQDKEESEGVLDVASIVASGKTSEFLAKKEREKAEKAASKKAAAEAAAAPKQGKMQNAQRVRATFHYDISVAEEEATMAALQGSTSEQTSPTEGSASQTANKGKAREGHIPGTIRKTAEVGIERFQAADNGMLERIAEAVHRVIHAAEPAMRSELWNNLIITGNGTRVKGFKEALLETIIGKYLISPSSATMFTSELPSNISTPLATGANTPNPLAHGNSHHGVNPMLLAATTASNMSLAPPNSQPQRLTQHSYHSQTPTSIKLAKTPDHLSNFKEKHMEEVEFAGAQMGTFLILCTAGNTPADGFYMTRHEYNNCGGPKQIRKYSTL